jgi:predicted choloylglycine hydrolase
MKESLGMESIEDRICHVKGESAYQTGLQIGQRIGIRLQENIHHYIHRRPQAEDVVDMEKLKAGAIPWMRTLPARFQEELEGLAQGAGISLQCLAEWTYVEEVLSNNCSAAICKIDDQAWIARNNDTFVPDAWGYVTIREINGLIPTISFGLEGDVFTPTGINQEKLWLHYNYLPAWDKPHPRKVNMPAYAFIQYALEICRNLADLEHMLQEVDRADGMLLFAVDGKNNDYALYECTSCEHTKICPQGDWLAGTNHHCHIQAPQDIQASADNSILRLERLNELISGLYSRQMPKQLPWSLVEFLGDEIIERRATDFATAYANVACPALGELWYTFGGVPAASQGNWQRLRWPWQ